MVSLRDRSALYLTIAAIETGGFVVKAEMINAIARDMLMPQKKQDVYVMRIKFFINVLMIIK